MPQKKRSQNPKVAAQPELPAGVKLLRTLGGHTAPIGRIAWSPDGRTLASPSQDQTIRLWDAETGECLRTINGHKETVFALAFDPKGGTLASASGDGTVKLWNPTTGRLLRTLKGHSQPVLSAAFGPKGGIIASADVGAVRLWNSVSGRIVRELKIHRPWSATYDPTGRMLASGDDDGGVSLWDVVSGQLIHTLKSAASVVYSVAFDPLGGTLAAGNMGGDLVLWDANSGRLTRALEGHTGVLSCVAYAPVDRLLATKSDDSTVRLWNADRGDCLGVIPEPASRWALAGLAFNPHLPLLATVGSDPGTPAGTADHVIHIRELDPLVLFGQAVGSSVTYTSAKIVLVGDSGVGKTGLGWRLAHGAFREHASTHGQQFWLLDELRRTRTDGAQCEAILWDLAGQPDYRLIHALFLDDADLALVLFDPTRNDDPLHGVEFWLKQLRVGQKCPIVLVAGGRIGHPAAHD